MTRAAPTSRTRRQSSPWGIGGGGLVRAALTAGALSVSILAGTAGCTSATPAPGAGGPVSSGTTPTGVATRASPAVAAPAEPNPSAVVSSLGAVPVPPTSAPEPTPRAAAGHPALAAVGGRLTVSLGAEGQALVTVLGPEQQGGAPPVTKGAHREKRTRAALTLQVAQRRGTATIDANELTSRDETGRPITLRSRGPRRITTRAGETSTLRVVGVFTSGSAQVTWRHHGHVLAVWTFTVELD